MKILNDYGQRLACGSSVQERIACWRQKLETERKPAGERR